MRRVGLILLCIFGAASAVLELYTRSPDDLVPPTLDVPADTQRLTLVFHGSGGSDDQVMNRLAQALLASQTSAVSTAARAINWSPASDNRLRAAANARIVGAALGAEVARLPELRELQIVGHSSGAFVLDALCEALRADRGDAIWVESVYLDPFGISGFIDWSYGARRHGHCADFALNILNTDDQAPATNSPLAQAYTLDVTAMPGRPAGDDFNDHYWPVQYLAELLESGALVPSRRTHDEFPRGAVVADSARLLAGPADSRPGQIGRE